MKYLFAVTLLALFATPAVAKPGLKLNELEYFTMPGLDVTVFADIYPDGHQTGVTVIQHGIRVAANGDLRLEASPGQWSPVPRSNSRKVDESAQQITQTLAYPDPTRNGKGFNPIAYPDLRFNYQVHVRPAEGSGFDITVDLDKPLPDKWIGKVGFNFELLPSEYIGASYKIGDQFGAFPPQPNGPIREHHGEHLGEPFGSGKTLVIAPENPFKQMTIVNHSGSLTLLDGRSNHNNGWFIVRSLIPQGATKNAIRWTVTPNTVAEWRYSPVIQISQIGYRPKQQKKIILEQDARDQEAPPVIIYELTESGKKAVFKGTPKPWGKFLRYHYNVLDFSYLDRPGMYVAEYRDLTSHIFKIADDVFDRNVWQPTLEYFLPVQMCHMRVEQKYRVWHDLCHTDDALMSPVSHYHFDGYSSGPLTLTQFQSGDHVPRLDRGGWHDAGDYDLRSDSQAGTIWTLAAMIEEFGLSLDSTTIDQATQRVQIHRPDGISDALQQVEHGLISLLGGYAAMGRIYRGIISSKVEQYVLLGDASAQTDGLPFSKELKADEVRDGFSGRQDDRWVFTEDNPDSALNSAASIAAGSRVLKSQNPKLAKLARKVAIDLYQTNIQAANTSSAKTFAAVELYLLTNDQRYINDLMAMKAAIVSNIADTGWHLARIKSALKPGPFVDEITREIAKLQATYRDQARLSPYGIPYRPNIWGAGWEIQSLGVHQYFYHKAWPEFATTDILLNALNFILGVHPGINTNSFASGVGVQSQLIAYGTNRADGSYIPGGVISGTALIRPDLPELKNWPYFWQQTEYVIGGGATNFMFLVLAAQNSE